MSGDLLQAWETLADIWDDLVAGMLHHVEEEPREVVEIVVLGKMLLLLIVSEENIEIPQIQNRQLAVLELLQRDSEEEIQ